MDLPPGPLSLPGLAERALLGERDCERFEKGPDGRDNVTEIFRGFVQFGSSHEPSPLDLLVSVLRERGLKDRGGCGNFGSSVLERLLDRLCQGFTIAWNFSAIVLSIV